MITGLLRTLFPSLRKRRKGDWLQTFTGRQVWPYDPRPEDVCLEDIAHALSMLCRFTGHSMVFYSVAQHSVLTSEICSPENTLIALLHDATEAYLADMGRALKQKLWGYKRLEKRWARVIGEHFGLGDKLAKLPREVKRADNILLATERRDLLSDGPGHAKWHLHEAPIERSIVALNPERAEQEFLARFQELTGRHAA